MRCILFVLLICLSSLAISQTFSNNDLKKLALKVNDELKGINIGNGITFRNCIVIGNTLIYQYNVPDNWYLPEKFKDELIANLKKCGNAALYFNNNINVNYYYFKGNHLENKISINSNELSNLNFDLGEYVSINGHPKAKEVNLKLQVPVGWEVKEGDLPNIVKQFVYEGNTYLILIKDNVTFFSRKQIRESLQEDNFVKEFVQEASSFLKSPQVIEQSVVTIDTYPAVQFKAKGKMERLGLTFPVIMKCWVVFFEDKIIFLQAMGINNPEFIALEQIYSLITNSVIFPEQYD